nr:uncharacterized protein LOC111513370 [Leptinotarsa decemlineata]
MMKITPTIFPPKESIERCSKCHEYLTVGPITISTGEPICGRCSHDMDHVALFYENLAVYMFFPCINDRFGCDAKLVWGAVLSHEKKCQFSPVECPALNCKEKIGKERLLDHFKSSHDELKMDGNQITISMKECTVSVNKLLILGKTSIIFKIHFANPSWYYNITSWENLESKDLKCNILIEDDKKRYEKKLKDVSIVPYTSKRHKLSQMTELDLPSLAEMWNTETFVLTILTESSSDTLLDKNLLSELKCPNCTGFMKPPIPMCPGGHSICNSCKLNISQCPLCSAEMRDNRNFTLERLIEHVVFPCKYENYGCGFVGTLSNINLHEQGCPIGSNELMECFINYLVPCSWKGIRSEAILHLSKNHTKFYINIRKPIVINLKEFKALSAFTEYNCEIFKIHITYDKKGGLNLCVKFIPGKKKNNYRYYLNFVDRNRNYRLLSLNKFCTISEPQNDTLDTSLFVKKQLIKPFLKKEVLEFKLNIVNF